MDYELNIIFPLNSKWEETNSTIIKTIGRHSSSSGAGFGERDMQFEYKSKHNAEKAAIKIKALKIPRLKTFIINRD